MPNPGKPVELKKKIGSRSYTSNDGAIVLPMSNEIPEPARPLNESGLALWKRTWEQGQIWLSARTDIDALLMTCEMLDERDQLRAYVLIHMDAWHERSALRELEKNIMRNLGLLGFTPTDRMKLGVAEVKARSRLEELLDRKANRERE